MIQQCPQTMGINKTTTATADKCTSAENMDTPNGNDEKTRNGGGKKNNLRPCKEVLEAISILETFLTLESRL
jgi:hypothetical protein